MVRVLVAGRYRGVAFQADEADEPGYPEDQLEIICEVHLRSELAMADGDSLTLTLLPDPESAGPASVNRSRRLRPAHTSTQNPEVTFAITPVIALARSDAMSAAASATSGTVGSRPSIVRRVTSLRKSSAETRSA